MAALARPRILAWLHFAAAATLAGCSGGDETQPKSDASTAASTASAGGGATGGGGGEGGVGGSGASASGGAGGEGGATGGAAGSGGRGGSSSTSGGTCKPGTVAFCYEGPPGTELHEPCKVGKHTCNDEGTGFGPCEGQVLPEPETCDTPIDDDCDGKINEAGINCACKPGEKAACYSGPMGTEGVGPCKAGSQTCVDDGSGFGPCNGEVLPQPETCETPIDDDCDGQTNEEGDGCVCVPGEKVPCYEGPDGTEGVGACKAGERTCDAEGKGFGPCEGAVVPAPETCDTPEDDDCDGETNEEGDGCGCVPGDTAECYTGPMGTKGVGPCKGGQWTCKPDGTGFGPCEGEVVPAAETCETPDDEDCDGQTNEEGAGCVCVPNADSPCYTGPAGTENVGICKAGKHTCNALGTGFGPCTGDVTPAVETCADPADEDCDGQANEDCPAPGWAADVKPILQAKCSPCHAGGGSGGHNLATTYADAFLDSFYCPGKKKGECAIVRIQEGSMPLGAGCTGDPAKDAGNPACLTAMQQQIIQAWVDGGMKP